MMYFFSLRGAASRPFWRLVALLALLNLLDYAVTVFAFPRLGMTEANGLVASMLHAPLAWPLLAEKALAVLVAGMVAAASHRQVPRLARGWLLAANGLLALALLWNGIWLVLAHR